MLFRVASDTNPGVYYLLNLENNKIRPLVSNRSWIKPQDMAQVKPVSFKSRDGLELHGYLTLPPGKDPKNLPLVVNPHGGPHGIRDYWAYNPEVQLLANHGYAVLQVNYRGSGGYGIDFLKAGYGKWGHEMQDDLTDATLWAVNQGIADKQRLCLYGGSYGGYATLQGLVREPDLYKCGIGYVGVYDLIKMRTCGDTVSKGGSRGKDYLNKAVGKDTEKLKEISPAYNTDKIKAKVFLAHGEDDVRVPMCQLNSLVKGLKANGVDYEVMTRDEGHGYQNPKNKLDFYTRLLSFLDENIGH
jgi:dipeptidyl aminopeptidase/acylaminoacyl peptidase